MTLSVRLRDVADGAHDVEAAHAPGGDQDHDEREHHPHAEGEDNVFGAGGEGDPEVFAPSGQAPADEPDHKPADTDAQGAADGAREEGVQGALEGEGADEAGALHSDSARYAELLLAFSGEHHEDQEEIGRAS